MRQREGLVALLFAGLLALFFHDTWLTGRVHFARDLTYLFHPMHVFTAENIQAGRVPLWNPYISGGVYWLGQPQTGLFYPGNILFWFFPFASALEGFEALHFLLSALGGYLLARASGGRPRVAFLAGLLWSLNGFWRARLEFPPLLGALAWIPWMLLAAGTLRRGGKIFLLLSLIWVMALFAGHLPHVLWGGLLAGVWFLICGKPGKTIFSFTAAGLVALLLAAPAVAPALDLMARSDRAAGGFDLSTASAHALAPRQLAGLLFPYFSSLAEAAYSGERFFWLGCFFIGLGGLCLAAAGFLGGRRGRWAWVGVFSLGALLAMGEITPVYDFLYRTVPFFRWIRFPGQYTLLMVGACLALMTAGAPSLNRWRPRWFWAAGLLIIGELFVYGFKLQPSLPAGYYRSRPDWIKPVQQDPDGGRLFLTPKAVGVARVEGPTLEETWLGLRHRLPSMASLPYHLRNVNPYGFSLNPRTTDRLLTDLYASPSFTEAKEKLDRLGVRWVASPGPLEDPGLALRAESPWFLYERPAAMAGPAYEAAAGAFPWRRADGVNRLVLRGGGEGAGELLTRENYDPGWRAYADGRRTPVLDRAGLGVLLLETPPAEVRLLFRPISFHAGLLVGLGAWGLLLGAIFAGLLSRWRIYGAA